MGKTTGIFQDRTLYYPQTDVQSVRIESLYCTKMARFIHFGRAYHQGRSPSFAHLFPCIASSYKEITKKNRRGSKWKEMEGKNKLLPHRIPLSVRQLNTSVVAVVANLRKKIIVMQYNLPKEMG